jgi:Timeless protein
MASLKAPERSINLKETEEEDNLGEEDDEEESEMKNLREEHRISSVWKTGGDLKSEVLWKLEKLFSSFVTKLEDEERNEVTYEILLNAHKSVTRATKLLTDSDNYTTRDFTLHIAGKKWVQSTLVPLMELGVEDRDLTMRCCRLLMVLTRNLNFDARTFSTLEVKPIKGKETKEEAQARFKRETVSKSNAQQQISAFLSFKEAICTEKCSLAVTNVLYHLWKTEKEERKEREENRLSGNTNEFTKREVATCLSYIRRILQVDAVPSCSSPGEVITAKSTHNKLVVQLRGALMVVPVICAELADKYNDAWLTDILRIIFFVLRGHDPKDFFKVWKEKCLIGEDLNFDKENALPTRDGQEKKKAAASNEKKTQNGSKVQPGGLKNFPVPASLAQRAPSLASKGLLGGILGRERAERAKRADEMSRHSRFGGQYRQALAPSSAPVDPSSDDQPVQNSSNGAMAKMISRPFSMNHGSMVPQAKAKRSKKNITFAHTDPYVTVALKDSMEEHGQRACVVAATLAERICTGMGLKQLVMRVGVDRVREEGLITVDKEIIYFEVLSSLLKYNRLKLSYEKSKYEEQTSSTGLGLYNDFTSEGDVGRKGLSVVGGMGEGAGVSAASIGWVPSLQNVINAFDNLSFRRVFESLEKLQTTQVKRFADMVSPLGLYKEMICYLRVLLESSDETHNEFAIARLYSIFYTSSERKDPLPRILAEWSPGTVSYSKQ